MSFWAIEEEEINGTMEMGGGDFEPIPSKTQVLAIPCEVKWDEYQDERYISIQWNILQPSEYKNRRIFQKIKVFDKDEKKKIKAQKMLAAIDHNAKGGLLASGKEPTDASLQKALLNKPMVLMLMVWEIEDMQSGSVRRGNWISAVSPKGAGTPDKAIPVARETKEMTDDEAAELAF